MDLLHPQAIDGAHHLDEGAAEAIELPDDEHVLWTQEGQRCLEGGSLVPAFPDFFSSNRRSQPARVRASRWSRGLVLGETRAYPTSMSGQCQKYVSPAIEKPTRLSDKSEAFRVARRALFVGVGKRSISGHAVR